MGDAVETASVVHIFDTGTGQQQTNKQTNKTTFNICVGKTMFEFGRV